MAHLPPMRYWGDRKPPKNRADIFSIDMAAQPAAGSGETAAAGDESIATLRMYGPIDSEGGFWGVSAKDVSEALDGLGDTVTEVRVRINSPGGDAFEGMAILNMLRAHPAKVVAIVDGIAASAASFIAAGCDETVMSPGTQLMIHDASGFAYGPEETMLKAAQALASTSNSVAAIYAESAGGTAAYWRQLMSDETWFTAAEAVGAKLADRMSVVPDAGRTSTAGELPEPDPTEIEARFDLSIFQYAGRSHAPAPTALACHCGANGDTLPTGGDWQHKDECPLTPAAAASGEPNTGEEPAVAFSDEQLTTLRQRLGVAADADEDTILGALDEALAEQTDETQQETETTTQQAATLPDGVTVIDSATLDDLRAAATQGREARQQQLTETRDRAVDNAIQTGRITPARREHWLSAWDADPEGTQATLAALAPGLVPVEMKGTAGDPDQTSEDAIIRDLFGDDKKAS